MAYELKLPELGENVETAIVGNVLVGAGDAVERDQAVLEVETDKVTAEVPSPVAGTVLEVRVQTGDEVGVGQVLLVIDEGAGAAPRPDAPAPSPAPVPKESRETGDDRAEPNEPSPGPAAAAESPRRPAAKTAAPSRAAIDAASVPAAPAVRRLAREIGLDIATVPGTGPGGRISKEDVKAHAKRIIREGRGEGATAARTSPPLPDFERWGPVRREPLSGLRRAAAQAMATSWAVIPHVTQFDESDVTAVEAYRRSRPPQAAHEGVKLTLTAVVIKVVAAALERFPEMNASLDVERNEAVFKDYVHIGVAVDTDRGLVVPVLRDAGAKGVFEIAAALGEMSKRARERKLGLDDMQGASFTVSNLGGLGTTFFTPIVNWPEVAILGVGRAAPRVAADGDRFVERTILPLSVSYDHRWIDGANAARFLRWIAETLEDPLALAMEG